MTEYALLNVFSYVGGHDFTTDTNMAKIAADSVALDATTYGSNGWHETAFGLKNCAFDMSGFWQSALADAVDPEAFADLGVTDRAHTIGTVQAEGTPAYLFQAGKANYQLLQGGIGTLAGFTLASRGTNGQGVIRGQLAKSKGAVSAIGVLGSGLNLGAVAANQFLYATFHVFSVGTTLTVQLQSAPTNAFAAPTTRATIGPLTARGGTWMARVAGPITDTWFRFNVSANTGSHVVAGAIGIGS